MSRRFSAPSCRHVLRSAIYTFVGAFVLLVGTVPAVQAQPDGAPAKPLNISANQPIYILARGNLATGTITTTICCGFDYNVFLSASGLPAGCTISFSPGVITAPGSGTSKMVIFAGASAAPGTYPVTLIATGGGVKATTTIILVVP